LVVRFHQGSGQVVGAKNSQNTTSLQLLFASSGSKQKERFSGTVLERNFRLIEVLPVPVLCLHSDFT